jgi:hypothetical protein
MKQLTEAEAAKLKKINGQILIFLIIVIGIFFVEGRW